MPYPSQITQDTILEAAQRIIELDGIDQFTMGKLALHLGVKTPSLYRYFPNKTDLVHTLNTQTLTLLLLVVRAAADTANNAPDAGARLVTMASAYRKFTHAHPAAYQLALGRILPGISVDADYAERLALP